MADDFLDDDELPSGMKGHMGEFDDPNTLPAFGENERMNAASSEPAFGRSSPAVDPAVVRAAQKSLADDIDASRKQAAERPEFDVANELFTGKKSMTVLVDEIRCGSTIYDEFSPLMPKITASVRLACMVEYDMTLPEGGVRPCVQVIPISDLFDVTIPLNYLERNVNPEKIDIVSATKLLNEMFDTAKVIPDVPKALENLAKQPLPFSGPTRKE